MRQIGVKEAWQLCEAFVRTHRTKNELRIFQSEMRSFLKYVKLFNPAHVSMSLLYVIMKLTEKVPQLSFD